MARKYILVNLISWQPFLDPCPENYNEPMIFHLKSDAEWYLEYFKMTSRYKIEKI